MWIPNLAKVICIVLQRLKEKKCAFWCVCQHFMIYIKSLPAHLDKHIRKLFSVIAESNVNTVKSA